MPVKKKKARKPKATPRKPKPVVVQKLPRRPDIFEQLAKATSDELGERLATPEELAPLRPDEWDQYAASDPYAEYGGGIAGLPEGYAIQPTPSVAGVEVKGRSKYEKFFAKPFDKRYPFAWWRYADPYAGLDMLFQAAQWLTGVLHLSIAWDFYHVRVEMRANFEKLVVAKADLETSKSIALLLEFYRGKGYPIAPDLSGAILRDLVNALSGDVDFKEQAIALQKMRPSRKALYYRIWLLWDVEAKYLSNIVHDRVTKGGK